MVTRQDGLGSPSQVDRSFPLLIDAAPQLLGEADYALAMTLLERMQREVELSFAVRSQTSGSTRSVGSSNSSSVQGAAGAEDPEQRCQLEPLNLTPAGAMLFWLSSPDNDGQNRQEQLANAGAAFDSYAVSQ